MCTCSSYIECKRGQLRKCIWLSSRWWQVFFWLSLCFLLSCLDWIWTYIIPVRRWACLFVTVNKWISTPKTDPGHWFIFSCRACVRTSSLVRPSVVYLSRLFVWLKVATIRMRWIETWQFNVNSADLELVFKSPKLWPSCLLVPRILRSESAVWSLIK